eukprot:CAMPEP_0174722044 /NCGR_PEP_ID=MMETSP1094-20130205/37589_1 /TAXON_ID=156173 /ORGANISM="Chrysochromulina brevifilum, Strain UTEX LB 985" /LENGTH=680 /DNA_ID=CAMNT_0015922829 /DNA_START=74 /DNA_END=2116 /DNA_ORIENTATION=+
MVRMLKRMQTTAFNPDARDASTTPQQQKLTLRKRLRLFTDDRRVEGTTMVVVLLYFLFIMLDFIVPEIVISAGLGGKVTEGYRSYTIIWMRIFWFIDLIFLSFFLLEIGVRVYAWGCNYCRDVLNLIDFLIVAASFAMLWVTLEYTLISGESSGLDTALALLRVFRIVRIFRLVIILNKFKRTREAAAVLRLKAKYRRQGSPVERVLEVLQNLKRKSEVSADRENLTFMMDVIVSGDLYTVSVSASNQGETDSGYSTFLLEGGAKGAKTGGGSGGGGLLGGALKRSPTALKRSSTREANDPSVPRPPASSRTMGVEGSRSNGRFKLLPEFGWLEELVFSNDVQVCLDKVSTWDFDVFELDRTTGKHPIVVLMLHFVKAYNLDSELPIDCNNLVRFMLKVEEGYKAVPFHNYMHAADVTHGTAYFMIQASVTSHISPLDFFCMAVGAAIHDFEHPGYNNAFLVASKDPVAILYNDSSVLENFHISSAWRLMLKDEACNPLAGFSNEQYTEARATMVYAILGTDMKFHFDHLTKFKTRVSAGAFVEPDRKDVRLLLAMCMHSADVSNPAKGWDISSEWAVRVMEEFFQQGENEAQLGLPVSPFMDRARTDIGKCQAGFISILIKPFFEEWTSFLGESNGHILDNILSNIKTWSEQGEGALGSRAAELHTAPSIPQPARIGKS